MAALGQSRRWVAGWQPGQNNMLKALRGRVYHIMEEGRPVSPWGYVFDIVLILLISLNVAAAIAETVNPLYQMYGPYFDSFEAFSIAFFTVEYFARIWVSVDADDAVTPHTYQRHASTQPLEIRHRENCVPGLGLGVIQLRLCEDALHSALKIALLDLE